MLFCLINNVYLAYLLKSQMLINRGLIIAESIFFMFLNFILYLIYQKFIKKNINDKIKKIETYLKYESWIDDSEFNEYQPIDNLWKTIKNYKKEGNNQIKNLILDKEMLYQMLESFENSVCLFNKNFELIIKNNRFNYLYENEKISLNFIKDKELLSVIKNVIENKESLQKDIYIERLKKYFSIYIIYLKEYKRYFLSIKDITQTKGFLEVQKRFISNISHELKTPLTNIKGYVIALEDADKDIRDRFINIIQKNIDKLENIIVDFLNISRIESNNIVKIENISIENLKSELYLILKERIVKSKATIKYNFNLLNNKFIIQIDFEKILMILKNLVENAIIYSGEKQPEIEISIIETKNRYKIGVKDNGIGINRDKYNKIFERFYRIDRARTSNRAGTGLGLAIVKELVELCGGKIKIISKEKKGSIFIFTILK